ARLKGRILFGFFLTVAKASTHGFGVDGYLRREFLVVLSFFDGYDLEPDLLAFALRPFYYPALEVGVRPYQGIQIMVRIDELVYDELLASKVTFIKIDGPNDGFQGVAQDYLLKMCVLFVILNNIGNTYFARQHIQRLT